MRNKYLGECRYCQCIVLAGQGIYEDGFVYCSEVVQIDDRNFGIHRTCEALRSQWEAHFNSETYIASIQANRKEFSERMKAHRESQKQIKKDLQDQGLCTRCGGLGRSDQWIATGSVCYGCGGSGKVA